MNDTLKVLVGMLEAGKPELQVAAAQVLGELRAKDPSAVKALSAAVRRSNVLGRFSIDALAKIGSQDALQTIVVEFLENEALSEHAGHLLAEAGPAAHRVLEGAYNSATGEQRVRLLTILAKSLGSDSIGVFVHALLTPELTEAAGRLLLLSAEQFTPALQKLLRDGLGKHLEGPLPEVCLAQVVRVLARVDKAASRATFLRFTAPATPALVRSAAFRALCGTKLTAAQVEGMMQVLEDQAQKDVHEAVREVLAMLPELPESLVPVLKRLLASRNPDQRLFALRMLRTAGGSEMAKHAIKLLDHADERFRKAAAEALSSNRHAIELLVRVLQTSRDANVSQAAAEILTKLGAQLAPKAQRTLAEKAVKMVSAHSRGGDLLFDAIVTTGGAKLAPMLTEKAVRLRRARRFAEALHILAKLVATPYGDDETRYQLAVTRLMVDMNHPGAEDGAPGNPTMGFFMSLVRSGFPLVDRLRDESAMTPEAMLRVGTHFADAVGPERRFGTELLRHLATRTKGRAGEEARYALRSVGG